LLKRIAVLNTIIVLQHFGIWNFRFGVSLSGAISCCPLYLFLAKEARKRMPLPSGLGLSVKQEILNY